MLLESLKALQLKSNVISAANDNSLSSATVSLPNSPRRHSLVIIANDSYVVNIAGFNAVFNLTAANTINKNVFSWDEYGDLLSQIRSVTFGVGCSDAFIAEAYREEVPTAQ